MPKERLIDANKITLTAIGTTDEDGDVLVSLREVKRAIAQTPTVHRPEYPTLTPDLRTCIVNGKKALFHRWSEKIFEVIKVSACVSPKKADDLIDLARKDKTVFPPMSDLVQQKVVVGIVEFANGEIQRVKPEEILFCDSKVEEAWKA